jgi:hypothetical protein
MGCVATMLHNLLQEGFMRHSAVQLLLDSIRLETNKDMQFYHTIPPSGVVPPQPIRLCREEPEHSIQIHFMVFAFADQ